jgi:hypothetical protein
MSYRGHADWRDMSEYVVHFTKQTADANAYDAMLSILWSGEIEARNPFGCALHDCVPSDESQRSACFSEIPLDLLDRLVWRRGSQYGVGFHQEVIIARGGGRVWYLDRDTPHHDAFKALLREARVAGPLHPAWKLAPLVDWVSPNYHFEWEREWRLPGGLTFAPHDVAFLFMPEAQHDAARKFLIDGNRGNGPAYDCPLLDPCWSDVRIQCALSLLPDV